MKAVCSVLCVRVTPQSVSGPRFGNFHAEAKRLIRQRPTELCKKSTTLYRRNGYEVIALDGVRFKVILHLLKSSNTSVFLWYLRSCLTGLCYIC